MKRITIRAIFLMMVVVLWSACATATPTPMPTPTSMPMPTQTPVPAPTVAVAADAADCTNLPATGPKIKIEGPWVPSTNVAELNAAASSASMGGSSSAMGMGSSSSAMSSSGMAMTNAINTAAFMVIHNCTGQAESIVKVTSNLDGMTSLMNFEIKDGKSAMATISQIDIPAGKKVELKSGSYHVMFMNLKKDLKPGDTVQVTLTFKNAGDIIVTPTVKNK